MMGGLTGGGVGGTAPPMERFEFAELGRECDAADLGPPRKLSSWYLEGMRADVDVSST